MVPIVYGDVHDIIFVRPGQRFPELCPFFNILIYP